MKYKLTLKQIAAAERKIGKKASKLIENRIIQEIRDRNLFTGTSFEDELALVDSVITKPVMGAVRLFRLSTTMQRHGFILQHGIKGKRSGHIAQRGDTFYNVKEHSVNLTPIPFIEDGINKSGAFEYLFEEIGKLRMEEISILFSNSNITIK
jgi:hypothetical protein